MRTSYHQNVFDLLEVELPVSAEAVEMIEDCERQCGRRLPESVREWYSFAGTVHLHLNPGELENSHGYLWNDFSGLDHYQLHLEGVLAQAATTLSGTAGPAGFVVILSGESPDGVEWLVDLTSPSDPLVWEKEAATALMEPVGRLSDFLFDWVATHYREDYTPCSVEVWGDPPPGPWARQPKRYLDGLWLRSPREPVLLPPFIDQFLETFDEEARMERASGPTTYRFASPGMSLKVTTDHWSVADGHSAWWLHAESSEALEALARRVWHVGDLAASLRSSTDAGRLVLQRIRQRASGAT